MDKLTQEDLDEISTALDVRAENVIIFDPLPREKLKGAIAALKANHIAIRQKLQNLLNEGK